MKLTTPVSLPTHLPRLCHGHTIVLLGSCFATAIGERLRAAGFRCTVNPHGVLYNPMSIAAAIDELIAGRLYTERDLYTADGLWHSPMHHGSLSTPSAERTLALINEGISRGHEAIVRADRLVLTLGTAYVYEDRATGRVVGNCHRRPADAFVRRRLTVDETAAALGAALDGLWRVNPAAEVVMTVSPVRHLRDGLHDNQLSKATLLMAIDQICATHSRVGYFPAYEILVDELRDYRFYADDLTHPSELAADFVWQRLVEACMDRDTQTAAQACMDLSRRLAHRPLHPDTPAYRAFVSQTEKLAEEIRRRYPDAVVSV